MEHTLEYKIEYILKSSSKKKSLDNLSELRSLGSSITSMEFCMIVQDFLEDLKLSDQKIKKISYNFNRDAGNITIIQNIVAKEKVSKQYINKLRPVFLDKMNEFFKENKVHTFVKNTVKSVVYIKIV